MERNYLYYYTKNFWNFKISRLEVEKPLREKISPVTDRVATLKQSARYA